MKLTGFRKKAIREKLINESIDNIPIGILYEVDNSLWLVNSFMSDVSTQLLNKDVEDADVFWNEVRKSDMTNNNIAILPDNRAILFRRNDIKAECHSIIEIMAYDVTGLYNIRIEKMRRNEELLDMNRRLKRYSENVAEITKKRELLERKRNIHDEFGRLLLVSRNIIEDKNASEYQFNEIVSRWSRMLDAFAYSGVLPASGKGGPCIKQLEDAAKALGIQIVMYGSLPLNDDIDSILLSVGGECLTNLARHAKGKVLYIGIIDNDFEYIIEFMNDGKVPERPIREGGGLKGLRKRVEDMGAFMYVSYKPRYKLTINVPKRSDRNV